MLRWIIAVLIVITLIVSCGGPAKKVPGQMTSIGTSGDRPNWLNDSKDFWKDGQTFYFRSSVSNQFDLAQGKRNAKAEVVKQVAEMVKQRVRTDYYNSVKGSNIDENTLGRDVADLVAWTTDNLELSGLTPDEVFWEKFEKYDYDRLNYVYEITVVYSLLESKYLEAVRRSVSTMEEQARQQNNKAAEERAKKFSKFLYNED